MFLNTFHLLVILVCLDIADLSRTGNFLVQNRNPINILKLYPYSIAFFPISGNHPNYVNRPYAQVRSDWIPSERGGKGSVVFPLSNTNAGQLNYQIQDAAKHRAAKDVARSTTTTTRSVYFQDYPELKVSQQLPVKELKSVPDFRPSPEYPFTVPQVSVPVLEKRENPPIQIISPYTPSVEYVYKN